MKARSRWLLLLLLASCAAHGTELPVESATTEQPPSQQPSSEVLINLSPEERALRSIPITMYMTSWCPVCQTAQRWLQEGGYKYVMRDVDRDRDAAAFLRAVNPAGTVPTFAIGKHIVVGFAPGLLRRALRAAAAEQ